MKAILFDFDGVLAQTMEDHFCAWQKAMADIGVHITREEYFPCEGMKMILTAEKLCKLHNKDADYEAIVEKKVSYYLAKNAFRWYPGVLELIAELQKHDVPRGVVSGTSHAQLVKTAGEEFISKFNVVITADMTSYGKPHPEPYLLAAQKLHLDPSQCIVVENAPLGIKAAKAAGMYCIAITSTVSSDKLQEADLIIKDFMSLQNVPMIKKVIQ